MSASVSRSLHRRIAALAETFPGQLGVSVRLVGHGSVVEIDSDVPYPLASVYKVPIMATLFHRVAEGTVSLDTRLTLNECDKSLGSGDLQYFRAGARLTLHDLCHLMIVHSDNTATDMIHYRLGLDAPNEYMHSLGLNSFDIYCPNREYFLIFLGWSSRFRDMPLGKVARIWRDMTREERIEVFREVRRETAHRTAAEAQRLAAKLWGISDERETRDMREASEAMDNLGSPADVSMLQELIVTHRVAPRQLTEQMLGYMLLCDARERLPKLIPEGVRVANKTGTVSGTVNDTAVIFAGRGRVSICTCLSRGVRRKDLKTAEGVLSSIGLEVYRAFRR
ncbi:MAG: serine hydrolase [Thermoplasmata archaeon]